VTLAPKIGDYALSYICIVVLHFGSIGLASLISGLKRLNPRELQFQPEVHKITFAADSPVIHEE